jgi:hypothetical protein
MTQRPIGRVVPVARRTCRRGPHINRCRHAAIFQRLQPRSKERGILVQRIALLDCLPAVKLSDARHGRPPVSGFCCVGRLRDCRDRTGKIQVKNLQTEPQQFVIRERASANDLRT